MKIEHDMKKIGERCKRFRQLLQYRQIDVARDTGYSLENISGFENGRNDNGLIMLWYIAHGMSVGMILNDTVDKALGMEQEEKE